MSGCWMFGNLAHGHVVQQMAPQTSDPPVAASNPVLCSGRNIFCGGEPCCSSYWSSALHGSPRRKGPVSECCDIGALQ